MARLLVAAALMLGGASATATYYDHGTCEDYAIASDDVYTGAALGSAHDRDAVREARRLTRRADGRTARARPGRMAPRACALRGFQDSMVVCLVRCLRTQG